MKCSIWRKSAERNVLGNGNFVRAILELANKWLKSKKEREKGDTYYLETYLGVWNGPIQFENARKIWPLLELLAKIR